MYEPDLGVEPRIESDAASVADRRDRERQPLDGAVRMIVLDADHRPVMERHGVGVNVGQRGLAVAIRLPIDPGTRLVVVYQGSDGPAVWHVRVAHVFVESASQRVLGLERLAMPKSLADAQWIRTLSAIV
jgi:hypothetical protein